MPLQKLTRPPDLSRSLLACRLAGLAPRNSPGRFPGDLRANRKLHELTERVNPPERENLPRVDGPESRHVPPPAALPEQLDRRSRQCTASRNDWPAVPAIPGAHADRQDALGPGKKADKRHALHQPTVKSSRFRRPESPDTAARGSPRRSTTSRLPRSVCTCDLAFRGPRLNGTLHPCPPSCRHSPSAPVSPAGTCCRSGSRRRSRDSWKAPVSAGDACCSVMKRKSSLTSRLTGAWRLKRRVGNRRSARAGPGGKSMKQQRKEQQARRAGTRQQRSYCLP